MFPFEFRRRQISQSGMQPPRVVELLEIVEDHRLRLRAVHNPSASSSLRRLIDDFCIRTQANTPPPFASVLCRKIEMS